MNKYLKYLLPLVYIFYAGCVSLCFHTHVVDGVHIIHSHPFSNSDAHSHTEAEFKLIYSITSTNFTDDVPTSVELTFFVLLLSTLLFSQREIDILNQKGYSRPQRGPPCSFSI